MNELRQFRKDNNLTQKELADILGVSKSYISQIERGIASLSMEMYETLEADNTLDINSLLQLEMDIRQAREPETMRKQLLEIKRTNKMLLDTINKQNKIIEQIKKIICV